MSGGEEDFDQDDWDNYGEEENEYGDVVAEATKQSAQESQLNQQIKDVTITYRPPAYERGIIAQIMGDFTDWIPINMQMYPVSEQIRDATKVGVFFVKIKLIKGFRYKYKFVWREYETVDENWHIRVETDGTKNNFIEV